MSSLSLKAAALVLVGTSQSAWSQDINIINIECGPSTNGFDYEATTQDGFSLSWSMNTTAETISFQVVSAAMAWTSIAFSSNGEMIGSDAVVGLPDDMSVIEYEMPGKAPDAVVPFADQEITDASVAQDSANGTTTVTFTRPLAPAGAKQTISSVPGDETILLFAYGPENPLSYHGDGLSRGSVSLDLFCGDTVAGGDAVAGTTPAPAVTVSSVTPTGAPTPGDTVAPTTAPTMAPTMMMTPAPADMDMVTPAPTAGDRGIGGPGLDTSSTEAPTVSGSGGAAGSLLTTAPSAAPTTTAEGDGDDTDGASRVGGGQWAAVAVAGVVTVVAALPL